MRVPWGGLVALFLIAATVPGCAGLRAPVHQNRADRLLATGEYEAAALLYESQVEAGGNDAGHALFHLALIRLLPESPLHDPGAAANLLERLVATYPRSGFTPQAQAMLALRRDNRALETEVERLRTLLDELRRIDLESDSGNG